MQSIEELQAQLAGRIAKLDEERKVNAAKWAQERAQMLEEVELERQQRMAEYKAKIAAHEAKKRAEEAQREAQRARELAARMAEEQKQNSLDEALRLQREKLEWLETAISNAEFTEEQHRKAAENERALPPKEVENGEINVEHPAAPDNKGEAVEGTEGSTPETPLMSQHLRQILRQASRN